MTHHGLNRHPSKDEEDAKGNNASRLHPKPGGDTDTANEQDQEPNPEHGALMDETRMMKMFSKHTKIFVSS
jgi:hypothetical protein